MPEGSFLDLLDPFGTVQAAVQRMLDTAVPQFEHFAQVLVMNIIVIAIVVVLVRGLFYAGHYGSTSVYDFILILAKGAAVSMLVSHYRTVIPGYDYSFLGMIDGQFHSWAMTLGRGTTERLYHNFDLLWGKFIPPGGGVFAFIPAMLYTVGMGVTAIAKGLVVYATLFALIGQALTRLFGAPALAFILVPRLNQISWNWLFTYCNYSMRVVVGLAYVFVMGDFVAKAVSVMPDGITEMGYYTYMGEALIVMFIFITGIPLIAQVTAGIMGGSSSGASLNPFR